MLFPDFEKTSGDIWTYLNMADPVSWLSLAEHCIKPNTIIEVVVATTSN